MTAIKINCIVLDFGNITNQDLEKLASLGIRICVASTMKTETDQSSANVQKHFIIETNTSYDHVPRKEIKENITSFFKNKKNAILIIPCKAPLNHPKYDNLSPEDVNELLQNGNFSIFESSDAMCKNEEVCEITSTLMIQQLVKQVEKGNKLTAVNTSQELRSAIDFYSSKYNYRQEFAVSTHSVAPYQGFTGETSLPNSEFRRPSKDSAAHATRGDADRPVITPNIESGHTPRDKTTVNTWFSAFLRAISAFVEWFIKQLKTLKEKMTVSKQSMFARSTLHPYPPCTPSERKPLTRRALLGNSSS